MTRFPKNRLRSHDRSGFFLEISVSGTLRDVCPATVQMSDLRQVQVSDR